MHASVSVALTLPGPIATVCERYEINSATCVGTVHTQRDACMEFDQNAAPSFIFYTPLLRIETIGEEKHTYRAGKTLRFHNNLNSSLKRFIVCLRVFVKSFIVFFCIYLNASDIFFVYIYIQHDCVLISK